jgi:hypothetical protein
MKKMKSTIYTLAVLIMLFTAGCYRNIRETQPASFSGIYPHLAYYNNEGECGTGAVVPWAGRLWVVTYGPHLPFGSSDKLYEIDSNLNLIIRKESIGGTPANRMIHTESEQLFIGPYAIDKTGNVRTIPYSEMPGRHTGNARHLTDPAGMIYYGTMEEGFYEVDVKTLKVNLLYKDGNVKNKKDNDESANLPTALLAGAHGKGFYSGQGVVVYSNNGESGQEALEKFDIESGSLSEWNGKEWKLIRRNQFVEVTGPGGISGNKDPLNDPIWVTGWDHKSILVGVRDKGSWSFFRLPKASHSYDGAHGWNTEWPRIRDVGTPSSPDYLMTMHGMFWKFPSGFTASNSAGIRPRSSYLKVIGDFTRWNGKLVFGCDDAAQKEFLNTRTVKGKIKGPGQSNSNLWFTSLNEPDLLGPNTSEGSVWMNEKVLPGAPSEPFLFAGWERRCVWLKNDGKNDIEFTFETDQVGDGKWSKLRSVNIKAGESLMEEFDASEKGEWIRIRIDKEANATAHFSYTQTDTRSTQPNSIFTGLSPVSSSESTAGLITGLGNNRRVLGLAGQNFNNGKRTETGYYELDSAMNLVHKTDTASEFFIRKNFVIPSQIISVDESSVLITDDKKRRWRLPLGSDEYKILTENAELRICREIATERDMFSCMGTFYELPAENADGFAKIRPISSHNFRINDYASYRGMLIMTGIDPKTARENNHIIISDDGKTAVWGGVIDDLWKLGKPTGKGGPWKNSTVKKGVPSDPYLIGFYDNRKLSLSHNSSEAVTFTIEADPFGNGPWMKFRYITVPPGQTVAFEFPVNFQARWIRLTAGRDCMATAWLVYN